MEIKCSWSKTNGYELNFNDNAGDEKDDDEDHAYMCGIFLGITKNLVEKGLPPFKIPKLFHDFEKTAIELLYSSEPGLTTIILNKTYLGVDESGLLDRDDLIIIENKHKKPL